MNISDYKFKSQNSQYETNLLTALSHRHEPLRFAIQYSETRKALDYNIGEFQQIRTAYVTQGGRCNG